MVLSDNDIRERCTSSAPMISPFVDHQVRTAVSGCRAISYGLSSYGYDIRLDDHVRISRDPRSMMGGDRLCDWVIDPKIDMERHFLNATCGEDDRGRFAIIPPHGFALANSVESFNIPRDIVAICFSKSTYARCGLIVNVTPLEPEWSGFLTLEISNTTALPARVYLGEGICQLVFHTALRTCGVSYRDRGGKYDKQPAIPVLPKV